ncbi:SH3 domain-containing protein [Undibacterium pigrum]|uniref:SH3 domain-containing protein n=1 Tax=Undibacterium pigrum TaxID=401470 RepID=A0A318JQA2_9BURK|nr:SH3 domain-containing protein [Undibacterium pigrum]PXX46510.1 SH3 domain-containing protein [Undibacterium pigrum]
MKIPFFMIAVLLAGNVMADSATTSQSTDLMDKASLDATVIRTLASQTRVELLQVGGAWTNVKTSSGQAGWVKLTALRFDASPGSNAAPVSGGNGFNALLTGGRTSNTGSVGTGVKGLDKEDLRRASPNYSELQKMQANAVSKDSARSFAQRSNLPAVNVEYMDQNNTGKRGNN